jgi:hypothetical protein
MPSITHHESGAGARNFFTKSPDAQTEFANQHEPSLALYEPKKITIFLGTDSGPFRMLLKVGNLIIRWPSRVYNATLITLLIIRKHFMPATIGLPITTRNIHYAFMITVL